MGPSHPPSADLSGSIHRVRERVADAARRTGRDPERVTLVAVTKTVPLETVQAAFELGLEDFGENYAAELARKAPSVSAAWHFLGKLQAGTAPKVADHAAVIHSGEPGRALERVAHRAERAGRRIRCLIQVDFTGRRQGVAPEELQGALERAATLRGIEVAGLMTLPPWTGDPEGSRPYFRRLRELRDGLRSTWPEVVDLSMGMSQDYEAAVEEGATMVRVGTALFGARPRGRRSPHEG
jgi:pyridoxal phosphate enzyme (YggS family)